MCEEEYYRERSNIISLVAEESETFWEEQAYYRRFNIWEFSDDQYIEPENILCWGRKAGTLRSWDAFPRTTLPMLTRDCRLGSAAGISTLLLNKLSFLSRPGNKKFKVLPLTPCKIDLAYGFEPTIPDDLAYDTAQDFFNAYLEGYEMAISYMLSHLEYKTPLRYLPKNLLGLNNSNFYSDIKPQNSWLIKADTIAPGVKAMLSYGDTPASYPEVSLTIQPYNFQY